MSEFVSFESEQQRSIELGERIRKANVRLSSYDSSEDVPMEVRDEIQGELDSLWDVRYVECAFSGHCEIEEVSDGFREYSGLIENGKGNSDGLWVSRFKTDEKVSWAVGFGFRQSVEDAGIISRRVVVDSRRNYGIVPVVAVDRAFPEDLDFPTRESILTEASDKFAKRLNEPIFLTYEPDEQHRYMSKRIADAVDACEDYGGLIDQIIGVNAFKGYVFSPEGGVHYERVDISKRLVKGTCEGLVALPNLQLSQGIPIRTTEELVDPTAGFCLAVRIDEVTATGYGFDAEERLYVPVSGQYLETSFGEAAVSQM